MFSTPRPVRAPSSLNIAAPPSDMVGPYKHGVQGHMYEMSAGRRWSIADPPKGFDEAYDSGAPLDAVLDAPSLEPRAVGGNPFDSREGFEE